MIGNYLRVLYQKGVSLEVQNAKLVPIRTSAVTTAFNTTRGTEDTEIAVQGLAYTT